MTENWKDGFQRAVSTVVLDKGHPAPPSSDRWDFSWTYGTWHECARDIMEHRKEGCEFTPDGPGKSVEWSSFQDTFEDNKQAHGIYVVATCACGRWKDITWLYEGTLDTILRDLLAIEEG